MLGIYKLTENVKACLSTFLFRIPRLRQESGSSGVISSAISDLTDISGLFKFIYLQEKVDAMRRGGKETKHAFDPNIGGSKDKQILAHSRL